MALNHPSKDGNPDAHEVPSEQLLARLETDVTLGLTEKEATIRLDRDGYNKLTPPTPQYFWKVRMMIQKFLCVIVNCVLFFFLFF